MRMGILSKDLSRTELPAIQRLMGRLSSERGDSLEGVAMRMRMQSKDYPRTKLPAIQRLASRLSSERGDSLVEALTAILIGGLALLMLAQAITSAARIVTSSQDYMVDYYSEANGLVGASNDTASFKLVRQVSGVDKPMAIGENDTIPVIWYQDADESVVCYERD